MPGWRDIFLGYYLHETLGKQLNSQELVLAWCLLVCAQDPVQKMTQTFDALLTYGEP